MVRCDLDGTDYDYGATSASGAGPTSAEAWGSDGSISERVLQNGLSKISILSAFRGGVGSLAS